MSDNEGTLCFTLPPLPDPARQPGETEHQRFHRASLLPAWSPLCVRCTAAASNSSATSARNLSTGSRGDSGAFGEVDR